MVTSSKVTALGAAVAAGVWKLDQRWATSPCSGISLFPSNTFDMYGSEDTSQRYFLTMIFWKILTNIAAHAILTKTIIFPGPKLMRKSVRGKQNDGRWRSRGVLAGTWRQWARMTSSPTFFPPFLGLFVCNQDWQWARMASFSSLFVCNQYW